MDTSTDTALALSRPDDIAPASQITPGTPEFERTASHMAREFTEATSEIVRLVGALAVQTARLDTAFNSDERYSRFNLEFRFGGRHHDADDIGDVIKAMERRAWDVVVDALGIKNVMSLARRKQFDEQLEKGQLPPLCEKTIAGILLGLTDQATAFAQEAAREVFDLLRPRHPAYGGKYATNNAFRVGRKVILPYRIEANYGGAGFRVSYNREQEITAIDGIFRLLDGKGVMRENKGPLIKAIEEAGGAARGETEYFRFKCFKNRNLHLEFKRLDLVTQLNGLAAGEYVLGEDVD